MAAPYVEQSVRQVPWTCEAAHCPERTAHALGVSAVELPRESREAAK
jgi:hypothetical protein